MAVIKVNQNWPFAEIRHIMNTTSEQNNSSINSYSVRVSTEIHISAHLDSRDRVIERERERERMGGGGILDGGVGGQG